MSPLFQRAGPQFRAGCSHWRKVIYPFEGPTRIDNSPRVVTLLSGWNPGVKRAAPRPLDDIKGLGRVRTWGEGPQNLKGVRGVNVVIHDNNVAPQIRTSMTLRRNVARLRYMARICLFD